MDFFVLVRIVLLVCCLTLALINDLRENKIRNIITMPTALLGLVLNLAEGGGAGLMVAVIGWLVPILALIIFYLIKVMGAGDIKLFAAIGAVMGLPFTVGSFVISIYFGGVVALVLLIKRKQAGASLTRLRNYIVHCLTRQNLTVYYSGPESRFPFAIAIVPATLVQLAMWAGGGQWL